VIDLRALLERIVEAEVEFVLVGGLAVNAWGNVRGTKDVDLVPSPQPDNLARLAGVLADLGGRVETPDGRLGSSAIATFLAAGDRTLVTTELGDVDVLQGLPQVPRFDALDADAVEVDLGGLRLRVCSLDALVAMKRAAGRDLDRADLDALAAANDLEAD
jgi:predicted nucleotidyltransferase